MEIIKLMRPKQWIKNLFVFAALIFSMKFLSPFHIGQAMLCFVLFCMISSSIYILNDIVDVEKDRLHPKKKNRPLAKGTVSIKAAGGVSIILMISSLLAGFLFNPLVGTVITLYLINNLIYSFKIKHIVIMDIISIAIGFILRVVAGAFAIDVGISAWILVCTFFISLFLGIGKRRGEILALEHNAHDHRANLKDYTEEFVNQITSIVVACTIMSYSLYTFTAYEHMYMMLTIPFVVYGIFRYLNLIYTQDEGGNPTELVLTDKLIIIDVVLWGFVSSAILYLTNI
ncbi:decaprenyl-phosphate phosphoribosyltransferase [Niameybacter massiliensis]|uniref:decaprenyl-phosphate phosphoribosyltransferase n=1 Tax=Niameybacter massiliensis TaxID=1658108 RepID=UPI0006B4617D|nr:decaprenyl-phosphate phosphoribosyltransferase [Niameybacter massiliensis]